MDILISKMLFNTKVWILILGVYNVCPDSDSFVRGGPKLMFFFFVFFLS